MLIDPQAPKKIKDLKTKALVNDSSAEDAAAMWENIERVCTQAERMEAIALLQPMHDLAAMEASKRETENLVELLTSRVTRLQNELAVCYQKINL